ncbi:hypothetical protein BO71DRAFT_224119 [Aspergillus ellipticus CBS 707.79]|uniref:Secreted protein n=1 Tax=Aspergillus ellipticus CBS 707.79 TaxID=1448320 RepID=A0A319DBA8_9EURO|nr:hypothetical protein BO71DRAFT_224119 [Aspergillus ellipticus CBS 707.79]
MIACLLACLLPTILLSCHTTGCDPSALFESLTRAGFLFFVTFVHVHTYPSSPSLASRFVTCWCIFSLPPFHPLLPPQGLLSPGLPTVYRLSTF